MTPYAWFIAYMVTLVAICTVAAVWDWLDRRNEVREWDDYLAAVREDAINEARYDALHDSDSPIHDALAVERLRAGLEGWGK